jgi:hypothetical protein
MRKPQVADITEHREDPPQPLLASYLDVELEAERLDPAYSLGGIETEFHQHLVRLRAMLQSNDLDGLSTWYKENKNYPSPDLLKVLKAHLRINGRLKIDRAEITGRIQAILEARA